MKSAMIIRVLAISSFMLLSSMGIFAQEGVMEKFLKQDPVDSLERVRIEYDYSFAEGAKQKMLGNMDQAKENYFRCMELKPERSASYYELSNLIFMEGDYETARIYARQAIRLDPDNHWYKFLAIEIAILEEKFLEGAAYYRDIYTDYKDETEYRTGEIDLLLRGNDTKTALKRLDELEEKFGSSKFISIRKKDIYLKTGKEKQAFKEMEKLIETYPNDVELMGVLAELYADKGEEEKALDLFSRMKKMNSGNPLVFFSLGKYYYDLGRKEESIEEFKTGFSSKDVNAEIKIQIFLDLVRAQGTDDGLNNKMAELLESLYNTDKGNPGVDVLYADYKYNTGEEDIAEEIYKRVTKNNPSNFLAWQNLLFIQNNQLDFAEMYSIGSDAVLNYPNQPLFLMFKGMGASQVNKHEEAIEALKTGLSINFNNPDLTKQFYISLGDAYYKQGNFKEAFSNFEDLLALDPDNELVLNNYSYYLSVLGRDLEKALEMIEKCINIEKDNPTYLDTYAWVLFKMKNYAKALEVIENVISLNSSPSGEVWEHYGDILFMNDKAGKAKEIWLKAKETGEGSNEIDNKIENGLK